MASPWFTKWFRNQKVPQNEALIRLELTGVALASQTWPQSKASLPESWAVKLFSVCVGGVYPLTQLKEKTQVQYRFGLSLIKLRPSRLLTNNLLRLLFNRLRQYNIFCTIILTPTIIRMMWQQGETIQVASTLVQGGQVPKMKLGGYNRKLDNKPNLHRLKCPKSQWALHPLSQVTSFWTFIVNKLAAISIPNYSRCYVLCNIINNLRLYIIL